MNHQKAPSPAPTAESSTVQSVGKSSLEKTVVAEQQPSPISEKVDNPAQMPATSSVAVETKSDPATKAIAKLVGCVADRQNRRRKSTSCFSSC
ncbi:MAG: hypothetical protein WDN00_09215 [Limisphaerales bacterium]